MIGKPDRHSTVRTYDCAILDTPANLQIGPSSQFYSVEDSRQSQGH